MLNSTSEEELPFNREIYKYLRNAPKEMLKNNIGHVFVAQCKTKCLSDQKPGDTKIFNEQIRERLRISKDNKTQNNFSDLTSVYEIKAEDLNQSILVDSILKENVDKLEKSNDPISEISLNEMDALNSNHQLNTQNAVFENTNHFVRIFGPYPDEPFLAAVDKCICLMKS